MSEKHYSIIPALDTTDLALVRRIVSELSGLDIIYGYKLGFSLGLSYGLPRVVSEIREFTQKPLIYDHQKAATDIPATGALFAETMRRAGIDEVILFPQAGPVTLSAWISALKAQEIKVIVGGLMTHEAFVVSEGGFINDDAVVEIYRAAFGAGVRSFVVPLTKPAQTRALISHADLSPDCEFYSPGYGAQGGEVGEFDFIKKHHLIIGRSILHSDNPKAVVRDLAQTLRGKP